MCKKMPVIPVNRAVDPKELSEKREGRAGGEAQGVGDPQKIAHIGSEKTVVNTFANLCT
jgi:hypothetical protein